MPIVQEVKGSFVVVVPAKVARDLRIRKGSVLTIEIDTYYDDRAEIKVIS